jgi:hypothetical protein
LLPLLLIVVAAAAFVAVSRLRLCPQFRWQAGANWETSDDRLLRVTFNGVASLPMTSMWLYLGDIDQ